MTVVQKSSVVKSRHKRVAIEYEKWLKKNNTMNTPRERRIEMFDFFCDSAYLDEMMKRGS
jgi:hypothetical protein